MSDKSAIEWTDATWNPVTGCTEVSPGCDRCYARRLIDTRMVANRKSPRFGHPFAQVMLHPERLAEPIRWRAPRRVFVNSLSDLFHRDIPEKFITRVFAVMGGTPRHTFQVLTKRPERMRRFLRMLISPGMLPYPNVWLGVSIESNEYAWRADYLRETPAEVRFLSLEPLLGSVDKVLLDGIDWVIVGGESGPDHRHVDPAWIEDVVLRCASLNIPVFVKQDSGPRPGRQGRLSDATWAFKQFPRLAA